MPKGRTRRKKTKKSRKKTRGGRINFIQRNRMAPRMTVETRRRAARSRLNSQNRAPRSRVRSKRRYAVAHEPLPPILSGNEPRPPGHEPLPPIHLMGHRVSDGRARRLRERAVLIPRVRRAFHRADDDKKREQTPRLLGPPVSKGIIDPGKPTTCEEQQQDSDKDIINIDKTLDCTDERDPVSFKICKDKDGNDKDEDTMSKEEAICIDKQCYHKQDFIKNVSKSNFKNVPHNRKKFTSDFCKKLTRGEKAPSNDPHLIERATRKCQERARLFVLCIIVFSVLLLSVFILSVLCFKPQCCIVERVAVSNVSVCFRQCAKREHSVFLMCALRCACAVCC